MSTARVLEKMCLTQQDGYQGTQAHAAAVVSPVTGS